MGRSDLKEDPRFLTRSTRVANFAAVDELIEGTQRRPIEPSLPLGASNDAIFGDWLGHSKEELAAYKAEGVIGHSEKQLPAHEAEGFI